MQEGKKEYNERARNTGFACLTSPLPLSSSHHTISPFTMRETLLALVAKRDALLQEGVPMSALKDINYMVQRLMQFLRARGELCSCHPNCLDENLAPTKDDDPQDD